MELLVLWLVMAAVVAIVAAGKGRSGAGWFFYGLLIWPVALVHALVTPRRAAAARARAIDAGLRPCPHCAEPIRPEAKLCRYCGRDLAPGWAAPPPPAAPSPEDGGLYPDSAEAARALQRLRGGV